MPARSKGAAAVVRALNSMPRRVLGLIGAKANTITNPMRVFLKRYPPELPGQQYQRTGDLGDGWDDPLLVQQSGAGVTISMINFVPYSDDVQTLGEQDKFFVGRWPTTDGAVLDNSGRVIANVRREAEAEAGRRLK